MAISVMLGKLAEGMWVSVAIFAVTLVFSLPLGLLVSFGRMSKNIAISCSIRKAIIEALIKTECNSALRSSFIT